MTGDYVYKNQATHFRVLKSKEEINFCYLIITCDKSKKITCISSLEYHQILLLRLHRIHFHMHRAPDLTTLLQIQNPPSRYYNI